MKGVGTGMELARLTVFGYNIVNRHEVDFLFFHIKLFSVPAVTGFVQFQQRCVIHEL